MEPEIVNMEDMVIDLHTYDDEKFASLKWEYQVIDGQMMRRLVSEWQPV